MRPRSVQHCMNVVLGLTLQSGRIAPAVYEEQPAESAAKGVPQEKYAGEFMRGRGPGAANMCCTRHSFAEITANIRPYKFGRMLPTAEAGPARERGPRAVLGNDVLHSESPIGLPEPRATVRSCGKPHLLLHQRHRAPSRQPRSRTRLQGLSGAAQRGGSTQTGKPGREKPITEVRLRGRRHQVML